MAESKIETRPHWEPHSYPTGEQWVEWFLRCTPEEQVTIAARVVRDVEEASLCAMQDHRGQIAHMHDIANTLHARLAALATPSESPA